ncbi:hypothetical protein RhiirB3_438044 [Rhizophagus irregularis]|nr:hypothetical protein RhiirB3_438044 [Rhizophagus irregularis]
MRKRKASVAFNDDLRLPLWDHYYSLELVLYIRWEESIAQTLTSIVLIEDILDNDIKLCQGEENTELKSRVAGNDQGSLALDEKSQNVKEVIAEILMMQMKLNLNNINGLENVRNDDPAANLETNSEPIGDDSDDEITEPRDFGEYLHGCNIPIGDVTHPANEEVNLPF